MVSAISGASQNSQLYTTSLGSKSNTTAALEKQISEKETEAKENKDPVKAATIAAELASLRAELAKAKQPATSSEAKSPEVANTASLQNAFDADLEDVKTSIWA